MEFNVIFNHCLTNYQNPDGKASFPNFITSLKDFKKEYERYSRFALKSQAYEASADTIGATGTINS